MFVDAAARGMTREHDASKRQSGPKMPDGFRPHLYSMIFASDALKFPASLRLREAWCVY